MNIGEIKYGRDIGKADGNHKFMRHTCEICGRERWVRFRGKLPPKHCWHCQIKILMQRHGSLHPMWKGGQTVQCGYVVIYKPNHPNHDINGYVKRGRLILESKLGKILLRQMDIHHINGIKTDDRPTNLMTLSHSEHSRLHGLERGRLQKEKCNA